MSYAGGWSMTAVSGCMFDDVARAAVFEVEETGRGESMRGTADGATGTE